MRSKDSGGKLDVSRDPLETLQRRCLFCHYGGDGVEFEALGRPSEAGQQQEVSAGSGPDLEAPSARDIRTEGVREAESSPPPNSGAVREEPPKRRQPWSRQSPVNAAVRILQHLPSQLILPRIGSPDLASLGGAVSVVRIRIAQRYVCVGYPRVLEDGPARLTLAIGEVARHTVKEIRRNQLRVYNPELQQTGQLLRGSNLKVDSLDIIDSNESWSSSMASRSVPGSPARDPAERHVASTCLDLSVTETGIASWPAGCSTSMPARLLST